MVCCSAARAIDSRLQATAGRQSRRRRGADSSRAWFRRDPSRGVLNGQNGSPLLLTYSNDGSLVVSGSGTGALWVWDAHSPKLVAQPTLVDKYSDTAGSDVAINSRRILAGASSTGSVELWDLRANAPWRYDSAHDVATLVDVTTGAALASVTAPSSDAAAFNPNDHTFALGTTAASILLVGAPSPSTSKFEVSERLTGSVTWSAMSHDGRLAAGATQSGKEVQLLDVATRKPLTRQPHLDAGGVVLSRQARSISSRSGGGLHGGWPTNRLTIAPRSGSHGENSNSASWDLHARTNRPQ